MIDRAEVERAAELFRAPDGSFERLLRRRDRKRRNQRIGAGALAIIIALVSFVAMTRAFHNLERPAIEPTPTPRPPGIFSEVGGWIAYGNQWGIWALDPSHPGDPEGRVRLSSIGGTPLAWSSDGSELLVSRESWELLSRRELIHGEEAPASRLGLFVLHADGTETHLFRGEVTGASFSPDGTTVVFAPSLGAIRWQDDRGIYRIDAEGGVPKLLVEPTSRYFPDQGRSFRTEVYFPTFSPDGTQIAFFDGFGDNSHSLRVVKADGSDLQVLIDSIEGYRITNLVWSPDGKTLAFGRRINDGIYTIGVDGSGLTLVIPDGEDPYWSPDGSRIWFDRESSAANRHDLYVADRDGSDIQIVAFHAGSGPLNPLVQPELEAAEVPAASEGLRPWTLALVAAVLILVAGALVIRRRRGREAGTAI